MSCSNSEYIDSLGEQRILPEGERRVTPRVHALFRVGRIITRDDEGLARIKNISDQGTQLQLQLPVHLGETLSVQMSDKITLFGQVVWTSGEDCGLKFDRHIDCVELLAHLAASTSTGSHRPFRLAVMKTAIAHAENGIHMTEVSDVSQRGMKLRHDGNFSEGLRVSVKLPSGLVRRGVVRWVSDNFAGVMLLEPFKISELGSLRSL